MCASRRPSHYNHRIFDSRLLARLHAATHDAAGRDGAAAQARDTLHNRDLPAHAAEPLVDEPVAGYRAPLLVFHVENALYALAFVYHFLKRLDMDYYVKLLQLMPQKNYTWIVALYASVSSVNFTARCR